jgi:hypothetical protein
MIPPSVSSTDSEYPDHTATAFENANDEGSEVIGLDWGTTCYDG